jgi:hypothetical protein
MNLVQLVKEFVFENGSATLPIKGNSMYPNLKENTLVKIHPLKTLSAGDCCVYLQRGILVIHRLLFKRNRWAYIAGDNDIKIEKIAIETIIGVAECNESLSKKTVITLINYLFLPLNKTVFFKFRFRILYFFSKER